MAGFEAQELANPMKSEGFHRSLGSAISTNYLLTPWRVRIRVRLLVQVSNLRLRLPLNALYSDRN